MSPPSSAAATVQAAAAGVSAHVTWQLVSRLSSFLLRAIVVRTLGPERVAETELNVSLFVSLLLQPITGFRKVSLRVSSNTRSAALCALCTAIVSGCGLLTGVILCMRYPSNALMLCIVTMGIITRALAEPHVIFSTRRERYAEHSRARALSTFVSGVTAAVAVRAAFRPEHAGPATALGHLAYCVFMLYRMRVARGADPIPYPPLSKMGSHLRRDDLHMAAAATGQSCLKYVLGNGEAFFLFRMRPKTEQGAYFLAGNFASIVARFFNESLEDQCFNVFSRLAPAFREKRKSERKTGAGGSGEDVGFRTDEEVSDARETCVHTMHLALKAALLIAILFASIGPAFAYSAVRVLYDVEWSENSPAPRLLALYFTYLVFMAANGVTEAFFLSAAAGDDIRKHTWFSVILSIVYTFLLYIAASLQGASAIIGVNCLNMALRTTYSVAFYCRLTGQRLSQLAAGAVPHPLVFLALGVARYVALKSEAAFMGYRSGLPIVGRVVVFDGYRDVLMRVAQHAVSGVFALVLFFGALYLCEMPFLLDLRSLMWRRTSPSAAEAVPPEEGHSKKD